MIATLKKLALLGAPLFAMTVATVAKADVPAYVRVRNITYNGSGCPLGSVGQNISPDRQAFTLFFSSYIAEVGPGVPYAEKRKNCQVNVDLDFPNGWSYTIATVDYRGYVDLQPGVSALQQSSYYFQGQSATGRLKTQMNGPSSRDYQIRDTLGISALVWSPCGAQRALNINSEVRADNARNPSGHGLITLDSIDGQFKQIYALQWTRCR